MGDHNSSDCSWKKMVIAKANNEWVSTIKKEQEDAAAANETSVDSSESTSLGNITITVEEVSPNLNADEVVPMLQEVDPLMVHAISDGDSSTPRKRHSFINETPDERKDRLAKMSAYAAQRLANETPGQRANRLKRMSEYSAKRLSRETQEQRAQRLAKMSAYAAKRLATETPEQRRHRLAKMSAYAAKRKKSGS